MNCISPWAPAELVRLLRPCPVSSMPMPASKVQGILYLAAAAMYRFLILAGMGSGGLCSESCRGRPGAGSGNPTPPSGPAALQAEGVGRRRLRAGCDGCAVERCAAVGHERHRVDGLAVDLDLEMEMEPGAGPGGSFDSEFLADGDRGTGSDLGVDAGQVGVAGADAAAVAEGDDVAVARVRCGR